MLKRITIALLMTLAAVSLAEDAKAKAAREELEKQLTQMVGKQPTKVRVDFIGLDDPNYRIEEATFDLDGRSLRTPLLSELSEDGTHLVWNGDVTPGKHTVKVLLVFSNQASAVLSDEGGYKWKIGGDVSFEVNSGIEVRVQVTPKRDSKQTEVAKRFKLALPAQPVMIAQLDDGKMPDPMAKPVIVVEVVDAGATSADQVAAEKKQQAELAAAEKKQKAAEAAEAKKQKAAEAAEAKRAAAEAKKQKATELAEARAAALAAKQGKASELAEARAAALAAKKEKAAADAAAKLAAAEEKKHAAQELLEEKKRAAQAALDAKNPPPVVAGPAVDATPVAVAEPVVDAGAAEVVDAGAPVVVAVTPVDAGTPAPVVAVTSGGEGPPWLIIGIAGGLAALVFLIVVARRRSRPPTLDD